MIDGAWWGAGAPSPSAAGEVSIEQGLRARAGIQLGDLLRFDIAGRSVEARVTSVREVDWEDSSNGGFMFVFRPGLLDRAPHTFIAPLRVSSDPGARARLQHDLVVAFPNVSAIDIREILARVRSVVDAVTLAVSIVGTIALASGLLILVGAVAMTKFQRVYEAAILRTLGATTRTIATMLALEYLAAGSRRRSGRRGGGARAGLGRGALPARHPLAACDGADARRHGRLRRDRGRGGRPGEPGRAEAQAARHPPRGVGRMTHLSTLNPGLRIQW